MNYLASVYARSLRHPFVLRCCEIALLLIFALAGHVSGVGAWTPLAHTAPGFIGLMMLLPDGTVIAQNYDTNTWYRLTPDSQGHYVNGTWTTLTPIRTIAGCIALRRS